MPGVSAPLALTVEHHAHRGAVLDGAAGVLPLSFGVELYATVSALEASQTKERRIPNEIENGPRP